MSFTSKLGSFVSKIWEQVKSAVASAIAKMGVLAPLLIISLFVFAGPIGAQLALAGWTGLGSVFTAISTWGVFAQLAVGLGVAWLVAPEGTAALLSAATELAGEVLSAVASVAADAVGGLWSSLGWGKWLILGGVGYLGYQFFASDDDEGDAPVYIQGGVV